MASQSAARVLVVAASRHGSTREIAEHIDGVLRARGLHVSLAAPAEVDRLAEYGAVVLGSAVYMGRWLEEARQVAERLVAEDSPPLVWLFSSGPIGEPPKPDEDSVDVAAIQESLAARDHQVFAGRLDRSVLGFGERAVAIALRAPEGDFRDWDLIGAWANEIADALEGRATERHPLRRVSRAQIGADSAPIWS